MQPAAVPDVAETDSAVDVVMEASTRDTAVDATAVGAAGDAILADPRFVFGCAFNSSVNNAPGVDWTLTGDRLTAFMTTLSRAHACMP